MNRYSAWSACGLAAIICLSGAQALAEEQRKPAERGTLAEAILTGKPIIDVRYRFEANETEGFDRRAIANTLRTRLGYETGDLYGFKALVEFENVVVLGDDRFNSTVNGRVGYPAIPDPPATEINRAQISYSGIEGATVVLGRQAASLLNQRFLGDVDFRQNQQTFDAARLTARPVAELTFDYIYIRKVHRIFGDNHPLGEFRSDSHIFSAGYDAGRLGAVTAYGLLLDFANSPANSSATWGARYAHRIELSDKASLALAAEYASQRDYGSNLFDYREDYVHGEATLAAGRVSATTGYERLGGNGAIGFATPLATLHKFQGLADAFVVTPAEGVEDLYATFAVELPVPEFLAKARLFVTGHDFRSAQGALDFGRELDAGLAVSITKRLSLELSGAVFDGGEAGPADRNIVWASFRGQY